MGLLDKLKQLRGELKAQSNRPHPVRRGPPAVKTTQDIAVEMGGRWGVSGPETWTINKRLEDPLSYGEPRQDMSVEGTVDLQTFQQLKVTVQTALRNRVKKILKFLGG